MLSGVENVVRFQKSIALRLDGNHATDGFAREVATIVAANDTLRHLILADNQITDVGVAVLAAALDTNFTLEHCTLQNIRSAMMVRAHWRQCSQTAKV